METHKNGQILNRLDEGVEEQIQMRILAFSPLAGKNLPSAQEVKRQNGTKFE
jgi:hypothetical protein